MLLALQEIAGLFLKFGAVGFGGPPAHLAMMEAECVTRRQWVSAEQFAEGLALCNLLPGPTSTQMAIWLGYRRAGGWGGIVAGVAFLLPAFVLLLGLTWAYNRYGSLPAAQGLLAGVRPAVIAVVLSLCWKLGKSAVKAWPDALILLATVLLVAWGANVALVLLGMGLFGILRARWSKPAVSPPAAPPAAARLTLAPLMLVSLRDPLIQLGAAFFKIGALLFGGGLVSLPLIQNEMVNVRHWLTAREFLDGVALGQVTPGPVIITATFIGFRVASWAGATVATAAIFLPSFLLVLLLAPHFQRVRKHPTMQAFLKGVAPAVVGGILAACLPLSLAVIHATPTVRLWIPAALLLVSLLVLFRAKIGVPWVVLTAALLGLLLR